MSRSTSHQNRSASHFLPVNTLEPAALAAAARCCQGCDLYRHATQTVFGAGSGAPRLMLIGEQPGDQEDRDGLPFVGPAGRLLDEALDEAGIDRRELYVTNAVKHFKFTPVGSRRLHAKPTAREVAACRPWLEAELRALQPPLVVCLGATAAQSLLGPAFRITQQRGAVLQTEWAPWLMTTWHPSAILRAPDPNARVRMRTELVSDLRKAASALSFV